MTTLYDNYAVPIVNLPFYYINGAIPSTVSAHTSQILLSAGQMRDSTNTYDLNIGNFNGEVNPTATANVATTIDCTTNGLNGLDTGSLGVSKVYNVFVVSDPVSGNPSGAIISLGTPTVGPLMPYGYSAFRHVGYAVTSSGSVFLAGYTAGNNNARIFMYDAPISVGTTSTAASYTAIDLTKFVPLVNNLPVYFNLSVSGTANDTFNLQPGNGTGDAITTTVQVTSQAITQQVLVLAQNTIISTILSPTVNYKNSGTDTEAVKVGGFQFYI